MLYGPRAFGGLAAS